jgi:hypothetical protein
MNATLENFVRFCDSNFGKKIMIKECELVYNELIDCKKFLMLVVV